MDLEDIRLKDPSEITDPEEQKALTDNWDQLTEEEKTTFDEFKPEEGGEPKPFTFKSEDELVEKVTEIQKKIRADEKAEEEARIKEEEAKKKGEVIEDFADPNYRPANWNQAFKDMYPKIRDNILKDISNLTAKQRKQLDEINKGFDEEIAQIRKDNPSLPAKGTKEGIKFDKDLAAIGAKYKLGSMSDAYNIYKDTHAKKEVPPTQKNLVSKISGGGGEPAPTSGLKYSRLKRPLDERIDEKLEQTS